MSEPRVVFTPGPGTSDPNTPQEQNVLHLDYTIELTNLAEEQVTEMRNQILERLAREIMEAAVRNRGGGDCHYASHASHVCSMPE